LRVRRPKPYVCVDCDFADHFRFQETKDLEAAAGTWLRCLAYSRAQEQDGIVKPSWLRRTFSRTYERVDELVAVGLLRLREDGDYELHAYAPRNQTREMLAEDRLAARERMSAVRVRPRKHRATKEGAASERGTRNTVSRERARTRAPRGSRKEPQTSPSGAPLHVERAPAGLDSDTVCTPIEPSSDSGRSEIVSRPEEMVSARDVRPNNDRSSGEQEANKQRTNAFVPTSTSTSINTSISSSLKASPDLHNVTEIKSSHEGGVQRGGASGAPAVDAAGLPAGGRRPLPPSERGLSGPAWLVAFTDGITAVTGRPCTASRVFLGTLERIVTHHAPARDAASACTWLRDEAKAFARKWDGHHPPKGLTPDGLERWLNEGRQGPPQFGRERIVQLPAEEWHANDDDFSEFGAEVVK
jgi:hypothetical protein